MVLEYATERAGDLVPFQDKELGLGVVNPHTETIESIDQIKRSVDRALKLYPPDKLFLNPDCGFGTFASRPVNSSAIASEKLKFIGQAAKSLRRSV